MEDLASLAAHSELTQEDAEAITGGLLSVLKKSKNVDNAQLQEIMDKIPGSQEALKKYEKAAFRKNLPNPAMMLLPRPQFAPPGPPPPVVIRAAAKGIGKALRKDKDAGNTKDVIKALAKDCQIEETKIISFVPIFVAFVEESAGLNVENVLRLPAEEGSTSEASAEDGEKEAKTS